MTTSPSGSPSERSAVAKAARAELKRRGKSDAEIEAGKQRARQERER